jgi:hypothetical protein
MTPQICVHSEIFRGGGLWKKAIVESLGINFRSNTFTFNDASACIEGFTRSILWDLLEVGLIINVNGRYPFSYRLHFPKETHKLTRREIIVRRMMVRSGKALLHD